MRDTRDLPAATRRVAAGKIGVAADKSFSELRRGGRQPTRAWLPQTFRLSSRGGGGMK